MHKHDPTDLKPCKHMETMVSAMTDGNLSGIRLWYTKAHVKGCAKCTASIPFLGELKERVGGIARQDQTGEMPLERWTTVEQEWDRTDAGAGVTPN